MDWGTVLGEVNLVAVLVATLASFVVGFIYYAPQVLGEVWRKEVGLSKKDMESKEGMGQIFAGTAVFGFVSALFLAAVLYAFGTDTVGEGLLDGAVLGFALVGLRMGIHHMFARKSSTLIIVEAGYDVIIMAIQGAIIAAMM